MHPLELGVEPVIEGVIRIGTVVKGTSMLLNLYLIEGREWIITDAGCAGTITETVQPALDLLRRGARIGRAVVCHAHADHFGGAYELLETYRGCEILVHRLDAAWVRDPGWHLRDAYDRLGADYPCPEELKAWVSALLGPGVPVRYLEAGDRISLDDGTALHVVFTPGHSPGHVVLWEPERRLVLASDAILGDGQEASGMIVAIPSYLDVEDYLGSIHTIQILRPEVLCMAHFPVMRGDAIEEFCNKSEEFVARLERVVWEILAEHGPLGVQELTAKVLAVLAPQVVPTVVAGFSIQAHLDWLERRGLARWEVRNGIRMWLLN